MQPFVVKPGEIVIITLDKISPGPPWNAGRGRVEADFSKWDFDKKLIVCFNPELITPDSSQLNLEFPLFKTKVVPRDRHMWISTRMSGDGIKPWIIFERSGTFLGDFFTRSIGTQNNDVPDYSPSEP